MLAMLDNKQLLFASMSEQHFYENKMSGVKGLEAMYEKMRKELRTISAMGYSIYCDAYYFSASDSFYPIEYRIADWDCISNIEMTEEELLETNANEFNTSITEFLMHFVEGEFKSNDSYKPFTL